MFALWRLKSLLPVLLTLSGTLVVASCATSSQTPAVQSDLPAPDRYHAPNDKVLNLLDPGKSPRQQRRYYLEAQSTATLLLNSETQVQTWLSDERAPKSPALLTKTLIELDTHGINATGQLLNYSLKNGSAKAQQQSGDGQASLDKAEAAGELHLSWAGELTTLEMAPGTEASIINTLRQLFVIWPKEEIGVGARWKYSKVGADGLKSEVFYELRSADNQELLVHVHAEQRAGAQLLPADPTVPGSRLELQDLTHVVEADLLIQSGILNLSGTVNASSDSKTQFTTQSTVVQVRQVVSTSHLITTPQ